MQQLLPACNVSLLQQVYGSSVCVYVPFAAGYHIVGSHSGVKMCRWTKSMLRGRGGCYKHTFYGIESHRCMETTPSLACANKCVFCWRSAHHFMYTKIVPLLCIEEISSTKVVLSICILVFYPDCGVLPRFTLTL